MMTERFNKQIFHGLCCKGDYNQVMAYLNRVIGGKRLAVKLKGIFKNGEYVLKSKNLEVSEFLRVYEDYLKWALVNGVTTDQCKEYLLDKLSYLFPNVTKYDSDFENMIMKYLEERGYFALFGTTAPYPDLYLWKRQTIRKMPVELPYGMVNIDVCVMKGVVTKGWLSYLSLGKTGTGGWVTPTGTNYFAKSYNTFSPSFKIGLLKHEAQHFYDKQHYPDIESADLEYRAKLVELIYYKNPEPMLYHLVLGMMGDEDGNDCKTNPHGHANRRIATELSMRLFGKELETNRSLWKGQGNKISVAARELLDENTSNLGDCTI